MGCGLWVGVMLFVNEHFCRVCVLQCLGIVSMWLWFFFFVWRYFGSVCFRGRVILALTLSLVVLL